MKKSTTVQLIFEKFNLLSDSDFKSWMLNNYQNLIEQERINLIHAHICYDKEDRFFHQDYKDGVRYYFDTFKNIEL